MARKKAADQHTGYTGKGNTRDVKVERIDNVTIYRRGDTYSLYYREDGRSVRRKVDGNLTVARVTARQVATALGENRATPLGFTITSPKDMVSGFLENCDKVKRLALRTHDRYRAALDRFLEFCTDRHITSVDKVTEGAVEDLVIWLRGQKRSRNGAGKGRKEQYATGGIKFILCTCRTAYNWAKRRRMLPPYAENPFSQFPIDQLKDDKAQSAAQIFTDQQEQDFFRTCDEWQLNVFRILAIYGMRVGELTHLLIEDVDFETGVITIQSKPWLKWNVKTGRNRHLPLIPQSEQILKSVIGSRRAGFVFLNRQFVEGRKSTTHHFASAKPFRQHMEKLLEEFLRETSEATEKQQLEKITKFCRSVGQTSPKMIREEFSKVTRQIGCPELTRVHDLRHLFSSRAQEHGANVLLVSELLGHTTLTMTRKYTHLGMESKRKALSDLMGPAADSGEAEPA